VVEYLPRKYKAISSIPAPLRFSLAEIINKVYPLMVMLFTGEKYFS
jgi:hypothetical protein